MSKYLLLTLVLLVTATLANNCQEVGSNSIASLSLCTITSPPPRLQWSINVTLKVDYDWKGSNDIKYIYLNKDDQPIDESCYQGQTIKGQYKKGTQLQIEHLCTKFNPAIGKGDKLYLMIFWSQDSLTAKQVIYLTLNAAGAVESKEVVGAEKSNI